MLGRVIKYDIKALSRYMLPIFALSLISAILLRIDLSLQGSFGENFATNTVNFISILLFVLAIIALSVGSFVVYIIYFYKSTLGEQGYFYMTLPATADEYLIGKLISGAIVILSTIIVAFASGALVVVFSPNFKEVFDIISQSFKDFFTYIPFGRYGISFTIGLILSLFSTQLMVAFCILSGQLLGKKKILGAFLAYIVLQCVEGFIGQICMLITIGTSDLTKMTMDSANDFSVFAGLFSKISTLSLITSIIIMTGEYFVARYFLSKKLNLE